MRIVNSGVEPRLLDVLSWTAGKVKALHPNVVASEPPAGVELDVAEEARQVRELRMSRRLQLVFLLGDIATMRGLVEAAIEECRGA